MLTKYQFVKYARAEMAWYQQQQNYIRNRSKWDAYDNMLNYNEKLRLELKLEAYGDMLTSVDPFELANENNVHIDVIAGIADLHQRYGLALDFYTNTDTLYDWSVNYTKTCVENGVRPSGIAIAKFINRLPSQVVTSGKKIPVQDPD